MIPTVRYIRILRVPLYARTFPTVIYDTWALFDEGTIDRGNVNTVRSMTNLRSSGHSGSWKIREDSTNFSFFC